MTVFDITDLSFCCCWPDVSYVPWNHRYMVLVQCILTVRHYCYFIVGRDVKYCDQRVCMSVHLHISKMSRPNFTNFSVRVTSGRGSVLLSWQCNMLCTSGFVDDVVLAHNGPYGTWPVGSTSDLLLGSTKAEVWCLQLSCYLLWSPYGIGQTIIFSCCDLFLFFLFFHRLISAAADWMSAIFPHMVWP